MIHIYKCKKCKKETEIELKSFNQEIAKEIICECGSKANKIFTPNKLVFNRMTDRTTL